jgi:hypothetical protein
MSPSTKPASFIITSKAASKNCCSGTRCFSGTCVMK